MTFMVLNIARNVMVQQKSRLEYQETCVSDQLNNINSKMQGIVNASTTSNVDLDNNPAYQSLQLYQQQYDAQKESIESQLKALNSEIESFQKAEESNIKSECKLNLLG